MERLQESFASFAQSFSRYRLFIFDARSSHLSFAIAYHFIKFIWNYFHPR